MLTAVLSQHRYRVPRRCIDQAPAAPSRDLSPGAPCACRLWGPHPYRLERRQWPRDREGFGVHRGQAGEVEVCDDDDVADGGVHERLGEPGRRFDIHEWVCMLGGCC